MIEKERVRELSSIQFLDKKVHKRHDACAILHLYYPEMWNDVRSYLSNLGEGFDLFVTIPYEVNISEHMIRAHFPDAQIYRCENRGRDIAPFLTVFSAISKLDYKYICKIHTKKSVHISNGKEWQQDMMDKLLGSPETVVNIKNAFDEHPDWGLIAPQGHVVPHIYFWNQNAQGVIKLARSLGIPTDNIEFSFAAGSMFWFRPQALNLLLNTGILPKDFDSEQGQLDGTLAHAFERFFGMVTAYSGYKIAESNSWEVRPSESSFQLSLLSEVLQSLISQINEKNAFPPDVKGSGFYWLYRKYLSFIEKYFPMGTRRRQFYTLFHKAIRILFTEGFRGLWSRIPNYLSFRLSRIFKRSPKEPALSFRPPLVRLNKPLSLPKSESPHTSIVIVASRVKNVYRCLAVLADHPTRYEFEVIVVDDGTLDKTASMLAKTSEIRVLRNDNKLGFASCCNHGAALAHGKYLLFLRDGVLLQSNSLDEMVETFTAREDCGAVGVKLVTANGLLRETGCVLSNDGSIIRRGAGQKPRSLLYSYLQPVDFCSSAILVPKAIFDQIGGFDETFEAYAEASLSLALRECGQKTYCQPLAYALLLDPELQASKEKKVFIRKYANILSHQPQPGSILPQSRKILYIDIFTPTPDMDAGSVDAFNHMKVLSSMGFQVTFVPAGDFTFNEKYTKNLQRMGIECIYPPYAESVEKYLAQCGGDYDIVILSRFNNAASYIDKVRMYCPQAKVVFSTVDLVHLREMRRAEVEGAVELMRQAREIRKLELAVIDKADYTLVVSEKEKELLYDELPTANILHIPLVVDIDNPTKKSFVDRMDIFFVGGYRHLPNVDAVTYFVAEIWPLIRARVPGIKFYIAGSKPPKEILNLASSDVIVTGYIEDLSILFNGCRLSVAPIRYGAGIKGKIIHSLGHGLPVVASSIAVEGTGLVDNENILVADTPQAFAEAVVRLYNDEELWHILSENGRKFFNANFSFEAGKQNFSKLIKLLNCRRSHSSDDLLSLTEIRSLTQYESHEKTMTAEYTRRHSFEADLIGSRNGFSTPGYCYICGKNVDFYSDFSHALNDANGNPTPNWRERMVCPHCGLNNRMRAAIHIFEQICQPQLDDTIFLTEQITPLFQWFARIYRDVVGSEYLANKVPFGQIDKRGLRNETLTGLTFADNQFSYILSFDVFEHIPDYEMALRECLRCLKPGGALVFTVPFSRNSEKHIIRARILSTGELEHILPPEYHGDPLNSSGSLCFYHFGWGLLKQLHALGFSSATAYLYWSSEFGYLGHEQILFIAKK